MVIPDNEILQSYSNPNYGLDALNSNSLTALPCRHENDNRTATINRPATGVGRDVSVVNSNGYYDDDVDRSSTGGPSEQVLVTWPLIR